MASETDVFFPETHELTIDAPVPDVSVDVMWAILDAFIAKVESARGRRGARKRPLPPPSSGDNSDTEPGLATTQDPDSEVQT